jgi:gluconolactonase
MRLSAILVIMVATLATSCAHAQPVTGAAIAASYPEGPLWQGDKLYYAEMGADRVSVFEDGRRQTFFSQRDCGPTAIAPYDDGFLILCHIGGKIVSVDATGAELREWDRDAAGARLRDPNDCYADGHGGVYFSDPGIFSRDTRPHGAVMHLGADGQLRRVAGPLWYPNGVFVDAARHQLYVDEHMAGRVLRFPINADGTLGEREVFADLTETIRQYQLEPTYPEAGPDGLEIGPNGDLYVAIYGEGRILRLSPTGALLGSVRTPGRYVTNISFDHAGGAATTASFENLTPPFPGEVRFFTAAALTQAPD